MWDRRKFLTTSLASAVSASLASRARSSDPNNHYLGMSHGQLQALIGDNTAHADHRAGYNGIWELFHKSNSRSIFVPGIAGLNLEHVITGAPLKSDDEFFEPRRAPMNLQQLDSDRVQLHQPPTPLTHVESWTTFQFAEESTLDMDFRCRIHSGSFPYGYLALFWASYINAPDDKSMYFLGTLDGKNEQWLQLSTQTHNDQSTVRHKDDTFDMRYADDGRPALFKSLSPMKFTAPFFYGNIDNLTWCVMFDRHQGIRFTHSPSGGGTNQERRTSNPAWDFQYVIENPELHRDYAFRVRTVLTPRCSREEILARFARWQSQVKSRVDRLPSP